MDVIDSTTNCQKDIVNNALNTENKDNSYLDDCEENKDWYYMPDSVLLNIFQYLTSKELATVAEVCKSWHRVSRDEFLWKDLFYRTYKIDPNIGIMPGKTSWLEEFKRLTYHIPLLETEVLKEHSHQVLHVSFSHNGKMFATCSKDGYIFVWSSEYPVSIKYLHDMKTYNWKYTQFSQFNPTDTLLLVCGVNFSTPNTTSGEIAIFTLTSSFDLQYRVMNKPYDIFGTWYSEHYFIYGNVFTLEHLVSASFLMVQKIHERNKCSFLIEELFRFYSGNASSIRAIMVANCVTSVPNKLKEEDGQPSSSNTDKKSKSSLNLKGNLSTASDEGCGELEKPVVLRHASSRLQYSTLEGGFMNWKKLGDGFDYANPIQYNQEYRQVEQENKVQENEESEYSQKEEEEEEVAEEKEEEEEEEEEEKEIEPEKSSAMNSEELQNTFTKYLIFTTGSKTFTPHQVGFKKIEHDYLPTPHCTQKFVFDFVHSSTNWSNYESVADKFDKIDHLIDLHGHIIGMRLSPDHRYLYVNTRPWPRGYVITNPLQPPPIAQEIDIHVIDLVTFKEVGTMLRAHKAYTPNNECFFIFLDVCNEYVASGAEDKHGYLWDRHYGVCLAKFPHSDVVNSVAFNPCDPEMLVTTSDDYTVKIWRSRAMVRALGLNEDVYHRGMEVRNRRKFRKSNCNVD